ncbi:MAG: hypothetical protein ABIH03_02050 [Pseudomonadota bacterium]
METAVHRDLVKQGVWSAEVGASYSALRLVRDTGDYGYEEHVAAPEAAQALAAARQVLQAVHQANVELFAMPTNL